ncbi:MAG: inositol monophosphatase family protein [Bryobacteraceae bacterium]
MARSIAARSAELALKLQAAGVQAESKADASPVTIADKECERLIASSLLEVFPDDGLLGEEGSAKVSANDRKWIIDPIDGTRDFLRGNPLWSVLIGLEEDGEMKAGLVHLPLLGQTYFAARGGGAFVDGTPIRISEITARAEAALSVNGLHGIDRMPFAPKLTDWMSTFWSVRSLGGTPDAMWLASGKLEVWVEPKVAPWDVAAAQVILEEAGAVFHDHKGVRTIYSGNAVAYVPALRGAVFELLGLDS